MTSKDTIEEAIRLSLENPMIPDRNNMVSTGQSLTPLIYNLVKLMKPKACFEWGPGQSSHAFLMADPEMKLLSYEHDVEWTNAALKALQEKDAICLERFEVYTVPDKESYVNTMFSNDTFDIILVDGMWRPDCLVTAERIAKPGGVILCHDWYSDKIWNERESNLEHYGNHIDTIQPQEPIAIFTK